MNFDIFDEEFYLKVYPFVQSAINQGVVQSALDHFQRFGLELGLTSVSRYYDEALYLAENPGVTDADNSGLLPSGLAHFINFGYEEGRTNISSDYDEIFYISNNLEIQPFIESGFFRNGLEHFLKFGNDEGRFSNSFLEIEYLNRYPELVPFINQALGGLRTGRQHYEIFGQFEDRIVTFTCGPGDDVITSFGVGEVELVGVEVGLDANGDRTYESLGISERDTLVGGTARDTFVIGVGRQLSDSPPGDFYLNVVDFNRRAIIQNYDPNEDLIQLGGQPIDYNFSNDGDGSTIIFNRGTLIAEIQGVSDPDDLTIIYSGQSSLTRNFLEDEYLSENPDVLGLVNAGVFESGLDHYEQVGQFEPSRSATFVGTSGNDTVTGFGIGSNDITGVDVTFSGGQRTYVSEGNNEFDTLIGRPGAIDNFVLGNVVFGRFGFTAEVQTFHQGVGEARIQGFSQADSDGIDIALEPEHNLSFFSAGYDLIIALEGDVLAVIEGGSGLTLTQTDVLEGVTWKSFTLV
ncbi:MAG: hypothetical protein ACFBSC_03935 [Microcoleaceae cyanobacterium]